MKMLHCLQKLLYSQYILFQHQIFNACILTIMWKIENLAIWNLSTDFSQYSSMHEVPELKIFIWIWSTIYLKFSEVCNSCKLNSKASHSLSLKGFSWGQLPGSITALHLSSYVCLTALHFSTHFCLTELHFSAHVCLTTLHLNAHLHLSDFQSYGK